MRKFLRRENLIQCGYLETFLKTVVPMKRTFHIHIRINQTTVMKH